MDVRENTRPPFFSVIVLAWQVESYISDCLDSIRGQTFADFETIIVAPPGNDRTAEICAEYVHEDPRFSVLDVENRGQLINRVAGFERARGEYLLCVDGDDLWKPELLETVWEGLKTCRADLVIFGHERFCEDRILDRVCDTFPHGAVYMGDDKKTVYEKYIRGGPINEIWAKAMRRAAFQRIGIDLSDLENIRSSEDLLYSCFASTVAERILYLSVPLYRYRIHSASITRNFRANEIKDYFLVKEYIWRFMAQWHMEDEESCRCFCRAIAARTADWIYRCAVSDLPFSEKRELYRWLKKEAPFYDRFSVLWPEIPMRPRHRLFVRLFQTSDVLLELYVKGYKLLR